MRDASAIGELEVVTKIINDGGVNLDEPDENGRCALHTAANSGQLEIIKVLIKAGADVNVQEKMGQRLFIMLRLEGI